MDIFKRDRLDVPFGNMMENLGSAEASVDRMSRREDNSYAICLAALILARTLVMVTIYLARAIEEATDATWRNKP